MENVWTAILIGTAGGLAGFLMVFGAISWVKLLRDAMGWR